MQEDNVSEDEESDVNLTQETDKNDVAMTQQELALEDG